MPRCAPNARPCRWSVGPTRPELVLVHPYEVPHLNTDEPADVTTPPAVGPPPSLLRAVVPGAVDEHPDELRWGYLD